MSRCWWILLLVSPPEYAAWTAGIPLGRIDVQLCGAGAPSNAGTPEEIRRCLQFKLRRKSVKLKTMKHTLYSSSLPLHPLLPPFGLVSCLQPQSGSGRANAIGLVIVRTNKKLNKTNKPCGYKREPYLEETRTLFSQSARLLLVIR